MDPQIAGTTPDLKISSLIDTHVRTMDIEIVRDPALTNNFRNGLNHIPLRQTLLHEVVETILDAWNQVCHILQIDPSNQTTWIRISVWAILKGKASYNAGELKYSRPSLK